jgi:hypothetical protein
MLRRLQSAGTRAVMSVAWNQRVELKGVGII